MTHLHRVSLSMLNVERSWSCWNISTEACREDINTDYTVQSQTDRQGLHILQLGVSEAEGVELGGEGGGEAQAAQQAGLLGVGRGVVGH